MDSSKPLTFNQLIERVRQSDSVGALAANTAEALRIMAGLPEVGAVLLHRSPPPPPAHSPSRKRGSPRSEGGR